MRLEALLCDISVVGGLIQVDWARKVLGSWISKDGASPTQGSSMKSMSIVPELDKLVVGYARKALEFPPFYQGQISC